MGTVTARARVLDVPGDGEGVNRHFLEQGWTDGLPIVPPTEAAVAAMLDWTDRDPAEALGAMPPEWAPATVEGVAINAVMAGCRPEYFPVVLAAVRAVLDPDYNLYGIQATTNPVTPFLVVNGPVRGELGINGGAGCLGPGWPANATIGRAVRLCLLNLGGGRPGVLDRATHGQPGKYTMCIAENEEENPWGPLHVHRGFAAATSTVTVLAPCGTQNIIDQCSTTAQSLLMTLCHAAAYVGSNNIFLGGEPTLVLCPEHAALLHRGGFTRRDVARFLYDHARTALAAFSPENVEGMLRRRRPRLFDGLPGHFLVPIAEAPEHFHLIVAGGPGPHSLFMPSFGQTTRAITVPIERPARRP
jgi:hypothetical protein